MLKVTVATQTLNNWCQFGFFLTQSNQFPSQINSVKALQWIESSFPFQFLNPKQWGAFCLQEQLVSQDLPWICGPCSLRVPVGCVSRAKGCDGLLGGVKGAHTAVTNPKVAWFAQSPVVSAWDGCTRGSLQGSDSLPFLEAELCHTQGRLALSCAYISGQGVQSSGEYNKQLKLQKVVHKLHLRNCLIQ